MNKINPGTASRIGHSVGTHVMGNGGREVKRPNQPLVQSTAREAVSMGNAVALNVGRGGVSTGRTVHAAGSQGQHGPVAGSPEPQGRDILSEFSPGRR